MGIFNSKFGNNKISTKIGNYKTEHVWCFFTMILNKAWVPLDVEVNTLRGTAYMEETAWFSIPQSNWFVGISYVCGTHITPKGYVANEGGSLGYTCHGGS